MLLSQNELKQNFVLNKTKSPTTKMQRNHFHKKFRTLSEGPTIKNQGQTTIFSSAEA